MNEERAEQRIEIEINKKRYHVEKSVMTGAELKSLGGIAQEDELWLEEPGKNEDKKIGDNESVELKSGMKFFSLPPNVNPGA